MSRDRVAFATPPLSQLFVLDYCWWHAWPCCQHPVLDSLAGCPAAVSFELGICLADREQPKPARTDCSDLSAVRSKAHQGPAMTVASCVCVEFPAGAKCRFDLHFPAYDGTECAGHFPNDRIWPTRPKQAAAKLLRPRRARCRVTSVGRAQDLRRGNPTSNPIRLRTQPRRRQVCRPRRARFFWSFSSTLPILNSSSLWPVSRAATSHRGRFPLPDHVSDGACGL
jgi:hypothetical protein